MRSWMRPRESACSSTFHEVKHEETPLRWNLGGDASGGRLQNAMPTWLGLDKMEKCLLLFI